MPTIKLSSLPRDIQILNISAFMCFPSDKDEDKRRYWSLKQWIGVAADRFVALGKEEGYSEKLSMHIGSWLGRAIHSVGSWPALANAVIGPGQNISPVAKANFYMKKHGRVVGHILKDILTAGGGVSTAAERYCAGERHRILKQTGVESPIHPPQYIRDEIWINHKYKDVAHLWAAFSDGCLNTEKTHRLLPLEQFHVDGLADAEPQGLAGFIRLSEIYWEKGIRHISPKTKNAVLDKETTWKFII